MAGRAFEFWVRTSLIKPGLRPYDNIHVTFMPGRPGKNLLMPPDRLGYSLAQVLAW